MPRALCEKLPAYASLLLLLLYVQETEPHTGWHLGNFPQVFLAPGAHSTRACT